MTEPKLGRAVRDENVCPNPGPNGGILQVPLLLQKIRQLELRHAEELRQKELSLCKVTKDYEEKIERMQSVLQLRKKIELKSEKREKGRGPSAEFWQRLQKMKKEHSQLLLRQVRGQPVDLCRMEELQQRIEFDIEQGLSGLKK